MNLVAVPHALDAVDAGWLNAALQHSFPGTEVVGVEIGEVVHGSLTKARLGVEFDANPHRVPPSLYLKAAMEDHGIPVSMLAEAVFYDVARPEVEITAPAVFAAIHDDADGVVVMEDLDAVGATVTDPRTGWPVELVADGLAQLAHLHAGWWGEGLVPGLPDFEGSNALGAVLMEAGYWEACVDGPTGVHVPAPFRDRETTRPWVEELWRLDGQRPRAFCHGDAHLGNTYVTAEGRAGFLDWGGVKAGHWAREVCYFLAGALEVEARRRHERDLLRGYLDELASHGADPVPSWDDAWLDYRRHCLHGLLWFLCPTQMQPLDVIDANVTRFGAAVTDHDVHTLF